MSRSLTILLLVAYLVVLIATLSCHPRKPSVPKLASIHASNQMRAAVRVWMACDSAQKGGSGVVIARDRVVTAWHVVECFGSNMVYVHFVGGRVVRADVVSIDLMGDVALLKLRAPMNAKPAEIAPPPRVGERLCMATGSPTRRHACGKVLKLNKWRMRDVEYDIPTIPGNSGSGIYDEHGRLVAIATHLERCARGRICGGHGSPLWESRWMLDGIDVSHLLQLGEK